MKDKWRYVSKDGNPEKEGVYLTVLVFEEWRDGKPTGRRVATIDSGFFGNAEARGLQEWAMIDQPEHGLVWTEENGSGMNERVLCWLPNDQSEVELPEGVVWEERA